MSARAVVLMYHRLSEAGADPEEGDYVLPPSLFQAQMRWLAERRQPVVSLSALAGGGYPDRSVVLTFDDGCDTDLDVAAPTLRGLGFPGAFFVNPDRAGQRGRSSWDQIRALAEEGFEVGSHGLDHTLLDGLSTAELQRQIVDSKRRLEDRLSRPVLALSLPGGSGGQRARRLAEEAGYGLVLGSRPGRVRARAATGILPRVPMVRGGGLADFTAAVSQQPLFLLRRGLRYQVAHAARALLGARSYSQLRLRWLERGGKA